jgi:NAD+ synthase (glutamine-hydrolysing)
MNRKFRIAAAQLNLTVGDFRGNGQRVLEAAAEARDRLGCELVVFPELTLSGYPPEDLLLRRDFLAASESELERIVAAMRGITAVVGHPLRSDGRLFNAASVVANGRVLACYRKQELPNYGVFDEKRYFSAGVAPCVVDVGGVPIGITICEDVWHPGPVARSADAGARIVVNLNASPYDVGKVRERENDVVAARARASRVPLVYVNLVGGQDELVFDGASFAVDGQGEVFHRLPAFRDMVGSIAFEVGGGDPLPMQGPPMPSQSLEESVYQAVVLGVRDYVDKNGFPGVVLGLSGGIDSALCLAIAVDALGPERVTAVLMPSAYTSPMSVEDARAETAALGVVRHEISITPIQEAFVRQLAPVFAGRNPDVTEENIQARCRGVLLMAISNKTGAMVLTTGNKSEMSVGYATLYGDMAGGFAAIKDVPKTLVYRLARYRNTLSDVIPRRVLERPPSAELAPDQRDEDSLPPYDVLDPILEAYVEEDCSPAEIVARGFAEADVLGVVRMVVSNEYKRRQAAPGVRITRRAFGRDRRYPLTSRFR